MSLSHYPSVWLAVWLPGCLALCFSVWLFACLAVHLSGCLPGYLAGWLTGCLVVWLTNIYTQLEGYINNMFGRDKHALMFIIYVCIL